MPTDCITYQDSGYFTPLVVDYLNQKPGVRQWYHRFPSLENFKAQMEEKKRNFPRENRAVLVAELERQYAQIKASALTKEHISLLADDDTFAVTTGHQLNLFTGPLYFLYKIITSINLARELSVKYPGNRFVPVYWMATEDHDFEEINYFNFRGKKFRWNRESAGAVGRLSTEGLDQFLEIFARELGPGLHAETLRTLFSDAYTGHTTLAEATRYLANALFGAHGLVIIDADSAALKKAFVPYVKAELEQQVSFGKVSETIAGFGDYTVQVNPREINLFYLEDQLRERIIFDQGKYIVNHTDLSFTKEEILDLAENHPEKISPNVIMRPLYQEVILPNLCYIGGGGEIAYWLELKAFFDAAGVTFPMLLIRNSVLLATEKQAGKAERLELQWRDLFMKQDALANKKIRSLSEFPVDLSEQKKFLSDQFKKLHDMALHTDKSFTGAVKAQEIKQIKGLENLEKRLLKAQKRKHADELERITNLQNELFPLNGLQERSANFAEFYLEYGDLLIERLVDTLQPFSHHFSVLVL
ncbi:bacillithiol biosynthesis cysteine-adding enzyme BshC [Flavobacterium magnum]|uniref:Putative cysteine ligase BshC n=1 Tax=Flavobacterium magnum TaxID=2162713 RepID=A0A2S0RES8_9FLAO|nr:bacillithiol biosynthesis cysteine-adding enzyme BshC [Flavobacterium magnum]AWA30029.1 bacillithiol biosynthesis cysteine-adding enzyme BshC [Flavobacterium magnum]